MDFEFSPEQEMLRASVRAFLADKSPITSVRSSYARDRFDPMVWQGLRELGVLDLDMVDAAVVLEELGRAACPAPYASSVIAARSLVPDLEGIGTVAIFEAGSRYEWRAPSTHVREGRVHGEKVHVPDAAMADTFVVTTSDGVYVTDSAEVAPSPSVDGSHKEGRVLFHGADARRLDADERDIQRMLDRWGTAYAVDAVGAAQRALEMALEYAKEREQFGKPIGAFQAVQHLCADMLRSVELARAAAYYACWALDEADAAEGHRAATLARAFAADALPAVGATAIQVFGGIGFTWEHDIHIYYKRLLTQSLALGTASDYLEELAKIAID